MAAREVRDEGSLESLAGSYVGALATSDCPALRQTASAGSAIRAAELDRLLSATKLARESREASCTMGRSLLDNATALGVREAALGDFHAAVRGGSAPGNHAVAYALVTRSLGITVGEALISYLYTTTAALVAAAQKLIPLGQRAAQRVLFGLHDRIRAAAAASRQADPDDPFAFAPVVEVASMSHERQRSRLYIS